MLGTQRLMDDGSSRRDTMKARFRANRRQPMVSVHRGLWGPLPENSLAAIQAAARWDVVEVDIRLDRDGTPYLMHDPTLERMTGSAEPADGAAPIELGGLRLKAGAGGTGATLTEEPVPSLCIGFQALEATGAVFDLDVKRDEDVEAVAAAVASLGRQGLGTLKIDVADKADLERLVDLEKRFDIMVMAKFELRSSDDLAMVVAMRDADVAAVEIGFDDLNLLSRATGFAGDTIRFGTYTLDPVHCCGLSDARALSAPGAVWGRLLDAGIGLIMTDQPEALSRYLLTR